MVEVVRVTPDMFEQVIGLLGEFKNDPISQAQWKNLFSYQWDKTENYVGLALKDQGQIVGFLGLIFSERMINGKNEKFCNLSSWIVKDEYRDQTLSLVIDVRNLEDYTLTNFTPSPEVYKILKALGFKELEDNIQIFPLVANLKSGRKIHIISEVKLIKDILIDRDQKILTEQQSYCTQHLVAQTEQGYCYVVFKRVKRKKIYFNHILYISNLSLFEKALNKILAKMFMINFAPLTLIDSRLLQGKKIGWSRTWKIEHPRLYRSNHLNKEDVDNLYSEFVLLPI